MFYDTFKYACLLKKKEGCFLFSLFNCQFCTQSQIAVKSLTRKRDVLILTHGRRFGR